jgi:hypothetical protein
VKVTARRTMSPTTFGSVVIPWREIRAGWATTDP